MLSLWEKLVKRIELPDDPEGCFELKLYRSNKYPSIGYKSKNGKHIKIRGNRASWELFNGPIPEGMMVLHHCDNPACVRPDHLFIGTNSDNIMDSISKGRAFIGEKSTQAILTNENVLSMRREYSCGDTQVELSKRYGVSKSTIGRTVNGENWKHTGGPIAVRGTGSEMR